MIIGEMVLSAFLQALFQTLLSAPLKNFFKRRELNEDVPERLNIALLTISAVLIDAEEKQITNPSVEKWVNELRDAVYHAEDALDDIATEALRLNIVAESSSSSNRLRQLRGRISLGDYLDGNSEHLEIRLEKVTMRLERLASQRNVLGLKELTAMIPKQRLPTTSLVVESEVFGRNGDKDELMRFLIPENGDDYGLAVVAIVGTGGVGKTTLSQLLYNDQSVQTHFGTRVWAHVSEEFDVFKITKKVYESVTSRPCEFTDLDVLQVKLKERLIGLPFLLVLDDLWNENFADWDLLRQPFISAPGGSRILVTTRSQRVASIMCSVHVHNLQPLSDGDCWSLFMRTVYGNQDPCLDQEIGDLAERIVHKCRGLPLAVKTLGGMLRFEGKVEEWERVLSSRIWDLPADKSNLLPVLRVSYYYLPAHLKRCFAYCSIFPKGHAFEKEKVVLLWMAEGFLQQTRSNKNLEELGEEYFSELESRSLFQKTKTRYMMHDFINELSQFASGEFSSKFENGCKLQISERTRYLSYLRDNYGEPMEFEALREVKFLRTFLPLSLTNSSRSCCFDTMVSEKLVPMFTRLRVLSLSHYKIARLPPDFFRNLSHARFLDLSRTELEKLPKSLCYMYNLQTLLLAYCSSLKELPTDFCNLINLRYLDLVGTKLRQMPRRFGRLKSLQTLTTFFVSASDGARICELGELNELHGKLRIVELQRVVDVADAAGANLNSKKYLKEIDFVWRSGSSSLESNTNPHRMQNETEVFENLRPHRYIKKLAIERYSGRRFPEWLSDPSFSRIMCIRLSECQNCSTLPSLGQLPGLKELYISGIAGLRSIGPGFYFNNPSLRDREQQAFRSLEMLRFDNMPDLEVWLDIRVARGDLFPSLKKLFILRCPELTGNLPTFLPSLTSLHIHKCGLLDFQPDHYEYSYQNLQTLSIKSSCDSLVTFPLGHFVNLDKLDIDNCISLQTLQIQNEHLYGLSALRKLRINDCQNLQRLPELSSLSQSVQVTVTNCRYLRQPMEQQQPQYQHPQFPLSRLNVSGSQRSHSHGSVRSYGSRSPSRYD